VEPILALSGVQLFPDRSMPSIFPCTTVAEVRTKALLLLGANADALEMAEARRMVSFILVFGIVLCQGCVDMIR